MIKKFQFFNIYILINILFALNLSVVSAQTLRFGTNANYPPFEYKTAQNEIIGFDIDIAKEICSELKVRCEFIDQAFDSLIPNLKQKRFDAIISSMDITQERMKVVSFTQPYYLNNAVFVMRKADVEGDTNITALNGKIVGVLNGTTHQKYLSDKMPTVRIKSYPQYPSAILDLKNKRIDAVFGDGSVAAEFLKKDSELNGLKEVISDPDYFGQGLAIAVRLDDQNLLDQLNHAISQLKANGKLQKIYDQWFA